MKAPLLASSLLLLLAQTHAQTPKPIGTVSLADATVTATGGILPASNGRAPLFGTSTVTAKPGRNAEVALTRGGKVLVCQTTGLHLSSASDQSLLLALDRGAVEIRMKSAAGDVVMTPDLRFVTASAGPLDLRLHVTFNGDTCVENRGRRAPLLEITGAFGDSAYQVKPGQHVLFEHGSLREVVDRETTPCGCPPDEPRAVSIADAILNSGQAKVTPQQTAAAYPFPAAASEGLAPAAPLPADKPGETHVQIATALTYDPAAPVSAPTPTSISSEPPPLPPITESRGPVQRSGPVAAIGRFFKRIFVR